MSNGWNKIQFIGNLGRDPELREDREGNKWCSFNVASEDRYSVKWFRVSVKGKQAEICHRYLAKGRQVFVEGRLMADKETGGPEVYEKRDGKGFGASFDVLAFEVVFLSDGQAGKNDEDDFLF